MQERAPETILVSDHVEQRCIDILRAEGFEVSYQPGMSREELKKMISPFRALIVRSSTNVDAEIIGLAPLLKVIGRAGTGVDNIDVDAATRRGIIVMNTPGGNTVSAAEHTVSMMLALARNIPQAHMSLTRGEWNRKKFVGMEVFEKTIGIVGLGKIGREVAERCVGLGMHVIGYDPVMQAEVALKLGIELVSLDLLYQRSDFITVHTPLTNETRGLLNDGTFAQCKQGVRIVNCARGGIVDEGALLRALNKGIVAGAALDVFETEPPVASPLLAHERVIVTPHLGASTEEAQEKVAVQISRQVADALRGRGYAGVVNASTLQLAIQEEVKPYLVLAEKLGSLTAQLLPGKLSSVTVSAQGELVASSLDLLTGGVLKGVLSRLLPDPVNLVNAPLLAREMGLTVRELRNPGGRDFVNLLKVRYETDREAVEVEGTVFGASAIRLVRMEGFHIEVKPDGCLLVYKNIDRPGILARVGSVLAASDVNIAGVSLGRSAAGAFALTVMNVDGDIPKETLGKLRCLDGVSNVRIVDLGE